MSEGCFQRSHVKRSAIARADLDLHDGAGVGAVAGQRRRRSACAAQIRVTSVVVVTRVAGREGCRSVVVKDQRLPGVFGEVDDNVMPLGRGDQQRVLVDIAGIEDSWVSHPGGRLGRDDNRSRQGSRLR